MGSYMGIIDFIIYFVFLLVLVDNCILKLF